MNHNDGSDKPESKFYKAENKLVQFSKLSCLSQSIPPNEYFLVGTIIMIHYIFRVRGQFSCLVKEPLKIGIFCKVHNTSYHFWISSASDDCLLIDFNINQMSKQ